MVKLTNNGHYCLMSRSELLHQSRLSSSASDLTSRGHPHTTCKRLVGHCTWYYSTRRETSLTTTVKIDEEKLKDKWVSSDFHFFVELMV